MTWIFVLCAVFGIILIVVLILVLKVVGSVSRTYHSVRQDVQSFSRQAFGTPDIMEGLKRVEQEYEETPKSISAGTSLYLPAIVKDFPDFNYDEMKIRAENVLVSYLRALDARDASLLTEGLEEFKEALQMRIDSSKLRGERERFHQVKLHKTAICQYSKLQGRCSVVFQTAVQYYSHKERQGVVIAGNPNKKTQSRYNVECIYIQDREFLQDVDKEKLTRTCPNCLAPLPAIGTTKCAYCGTPVLELNIEHSWYFNSVKEV